MGLSLLCKAGPKPRTPPTARPAPGLSGIPSLARGAGNDPKVPLSRDFRVQKRPLGAVTFQGSRPFPVWRLLSGPPEPTAFHPTQGLSREGAGGLQAPSSRPQPAESPSPKGQRPPPSPRSPPNFSPRPLGLWGEDKTPPQLTDISILVVVLLQIRF